MENIEINEKTIKEQLIPNIVGKDTFNPQFREISSLTLNMGAVTSSCHLIMKAIYNGLRKHH